MASSSSTASTFHNTNNLVVPPPPPAQPLQLEQLEPQPVRNDLPFLCRIAVFALLVFLLTSIFTFIIWVIFHSNFPQLRVSTASISRITISKDNVSAECNVTLLLSNTNKHVLAIYERMDVSLIYPSQRVMLSQFYVTPFLQSGSNCTRIESGFRISDVFGTDAVKALNRDVDSGSLKLEIKVIGVVSWRFGKWRTPSQFVIAYCEDLVFGFSGNRDVGRFENVGRECQVYLSSR